GYFGEFLSLKVSYVFKNSLSKDDVEALIFKLNGRLEDVGLNQVWRRVRYGYVDTIVLDIWPKERRQSCGPASDIEKGAPSALRQPVYNSCGLFKAIVGSAVFQIFLAPKVLLVEPTADIAPRNGVFTGCRVVHNRSYRRASGRAWWCSA